MVNLESEVPYLYWTLDRLGDLEQSQNRYRFDGSVWKADMIRSTLWRIPPDLRLASGMGQGLAACEVSAKSEGHYVHRSEGVVYDAVRADTLNHVVLTGRWTETDFGKGVFIAVFPIKEGLEILLETAATIPIETVVSAVASRR